MRTPMLTLWVATLAGCYSPSFRDCEVTCASGICPAGSTCEQGICRVEGFGGACMPSSDAALHDGRSNGDGQGQGDATNSDGNGFACEPVSGNPPTGHHNPGLACLSGGCHAPGGLATTFSYAGTLWKNAQGTQPYAGATVIVSVVGVETKAITADNGNFWFVPAVIPSPTAVLQAQTRASACPTTTPMTARLGTGDGNCNGCHRNNGSTSPIYLVP